MDFLVLLLLFIELALIFMFINYFQPICTNDQIEEAASLLICNSQWPSS